MFRIYCHIPLDKGRQSGPQTEHHTRSQGWIMVDGILHGIHSGFVLVHIPRAQVFTVY